jgi:hypothetical protein
MNEVVVTYTANARSQETSTNQPVCLSGSLAQRLLLKAAGDA